MSRRLRGLLNGLRAQLNRLRGMLRRVRGLIAPPARVPDPPAPPVEPACATQTARLQCNRAIRAVISAGCAESLAGCVGSRRPGGPNAPGCNPTPRLREQVRGLRRVMWLMFGEMQRMRGETPQMRDAITAGSADVLNRLLPAFQGRLRLPSVHSASSLRRSPRSDSSKTANRSRSATRHIRQLGQNPPNPFPIS
jgi:hypothetical protein